MQPLNQGTKGAEISVREKDNSLLARKAASEGIVLLKNDGVLPLTTKKVALFGHGAGLTCNVGTGSGEVNPRYSVTIVEGLKNNGLEVATQSWVDAYTQQYYRTLDEWNARRKAAVARINDKKKKQKILDSLPFVFSGEGPLSANDFQNLGTDTVLYVLSRQAGEGHDRVFSKGDWQLTDVEYGNIQKITSAFKHVIVIINAGFYIDLSFMDDFPSIQGLIFMGQAGMEGGNALADILTGKVNPSGKLCATWAMKYGDYPSSTTFSHNDGNVVDEDYTEDIFVGYRYFDTFKVKPRYAFGFGLSYSDFSYTVREVTYEKSIIKIKFDLKNTGTVWAKETVQIYLSFPGYQNIEYQRLMAFKKTKTLAPNEIITLTLGIDMNFATSYDQESACFFLARGEYIVRIGNASDHTQPAARVILEKRIVTEVCKNACRPQRHFKTLVAPRRSVEELPKNLPIVEPNVFLFETDIDKYKTCSLALPSVKALAIVSKMSPKEQIALTIGNGYQGALQIQLDGAAGYTTGSMMKKHHLPNIVMADGPAGLRVVNQVKEKLKDGREQVTAFYATEWPTATVLAQTWNTDMVTKIGEAIGQEMLEFGVTLWLAPGMNIQRNPLCGRNFEYFSEDPLVSGIMAVSLTNGVQKRPGLGTTLKHFACNNQEDNRHHASSNVTERALREIYLRGFELAVRLSQPKAIMSSYNLINGVYAPNNEELLTDILRHEWGFSGLVMTDWWSCSKDRGNSALCVPAGNDLIMPGGKDDQKVVEKAFRKKKIAADDLKLSAARVVDVLLANPFIKISD